jgi:spore germination cell wall hydrolase CwlJ-like protein
MRASSRAGLGLASLGCLLGAATYAVPSIASEGSASAGTATAMLAAVTAPLLAVDVQTLEKRGPDFSTSGQDQGSDAQAAGSVTDQSAEALPQSLEDVVAEHFAETTGDTQGDCLASSVYFESKGEPLKGQLAVAQTILNRASSGRFADTVCGVIRQPGQFSFVRHNGEVPDAPHSSEAWQRSVAVAIVAREGLWKQVAPEAMFFHARRVSPGWGKIKVASLGHHIFFR